MTYPRVDIPPVYRRAVEVLNEDGWCQGTAESPDGRHCAIGALRIAAELPVEGAWDVDIPLEDALLRPMQDHLGSLVSVWNDTEGRTEDEVKAALLTVAAVAECVGPLVSVDDKGVVEVTQ